jgi:hypothetical protein
VNEDLKFDTVYADADSSIYSIYGSGTLLLFDTNYSIKSLSNQFINNNDSIAWGEPGIELTFGTGQVIGSSVITTSKLIERTVMMTGDSIGRTRIDSFTIKGDTLIRNNKERFLPAGRLTQELDSFLRRDWTTIRRRDSR